LSLATSKSFSEDEEAEGIHKSHGNCVGEVALHLL